VTLAETQAVFHACATGDASRRAEVAGRLVVGTAALPAAERLGIYAEMWGLRQREAMREDFPALAALLGGEPFDAVAAEYLAAFPSDHFDLGAIGRFLARHLRARPVPGRPDAADLAALERARVAVFFEAEADTVTSVALRGLRPERFSAARLRLVPALRVLRVRHDVSSLWRALVRGEPPPPPSPGRGAVAVWRSGFDVFHAVVPGDEADAVAAARRGAPLAEVLGAFEGRADPAAEALDAIESWFAEGWVAQVRALGAPGPGASFAE
jgi:hypothetical protein